MARFITALIVFSANVGTVAFGDGNDLFSSVRTESVFSEGKSTAQLTVPTRLNDAESMRDALNAAGFDSKVAGSRTVTLKKELDIWTFPVLLTISEDERSVAIILGLKSIKDTNELTAEVLLQMMEVSQKNAPAVMTYSSARERTEIYSVLKNDELDGLTLRAEINRLAIVAKNNAKVWAATDADKSISNAELDQSKTETESPQPTEPIAPTKTSLVGQWSAARSATEAFAVEFKVDGTFNLVYVKNGKQTKSSGKFAQTLDELNLEGSDGLKLSGKLSVKSDSEFVFSPGNAGDLTFKKAS